MNLAIAPKTAEFFIATGMGEVVQAIAPHQRGRVRYQATTWPARFHDDAHCEVAALPGMAVKIVGREGLTLLVVPTDRSAIT